MLSEHATNHSAALLFTVGSAVITHSLASRSFLSTRVHWKKDKTAMAQHPNNWNTCLHLSSSREPLCTTSTCKCTHILVLSMHSRPLVLVLYEQYNLIVNLGQSPGTPESAHSRWTPTTDKLPRYTHSDSYQILRYSSKHVQHRQTFTMERKRSWILVW